MGLAPPHEIVTQTMATWGNESLGQLRAHLEHEAYKGPEADHVQRQPHQHLVEDGADEEDTAGRHGLGHAVPDGRVVDMPEQPLVHRHVPQPPVVADCGCIPPVLQYRVRVDALTVLRLPYPSSHVDKLGRA